MPVGPFFADFLCRKHKLAIELDGLTQDVRPEGDAARDRDRWLADYGYRVLRFTNAEVLGDPEAVARSIREALPRRAHP